jgi:hypothetical protein
MLLAFVVSVVADAARPDTALEAIAIVVLPAAVNWPWLLTVNVATLDALPYDAAVTVVSLTLSVFPDFESPEPAVI